MEGGGWVGDGVGVEGWWAWRGWVLERDWGYEQEGLECLTTKRRWRCWSGLVLVGGDGERLVVAAGQCRRRRQRAEWRHCYLVGGEADGEVDEEVLERERPLRHQLMKRTQDGWKMKTRPTRPFLGEV